LFNLISDLSSIKVRLEVQEFRKRKTDISFLVGDYSKSNSLIGFIPKITLNQTIKNMLHS